MRITATFPVQNPGSFKKKLVSWAGNFSVSVFLDNNNYKNYLHQQRDCLLAADVVADIPQNTTDHFSSLKNFFDTKKDWVFGYFSYDLKSQTEPKVFSGKDDRFDSIEFPLAYFFQPRHVIEWKGDRLIISSFDDPQKIFESIKESKIKKNGSTGFIPVNRRLTKDYYFSAMQSLKNHIAHGDLYEVNFCQEFFTENFKGDPVTLFDRLNQISPAPFACFLRHHEKFLLCSSPERFLKKEKKQLVAQPIKGTIRRAPEIENDFRLQETLRHSQKDQAENVMIVDLMRNDLARSSVAGSVKAEELFGIYSFPQVHQMISTITSQLREDVHFVDAIKHAFPMGSMTGAPKIMAMQLIDHYEKTKRGLFSGSVGYITPDGDFDFNVVIRSFLYNRVNQYLSFQTGGAIVYDSDPEKEYEECLLKAKGMMNALGMEEGLLAK